MLRTRRDAVPGTWFGPPQPPDVPLRQHHRGVEPDDREPLRDGDDGPDDLFADLRLEEVELRRVVPREARPVVAVVDEPLCAARPVEALEDDRGIAVVPVVVLEDDPGG